MDNSLAPLGDISSTPKRSEKFVPWEPFKGAAGRPTDKNENSEATRAAEKDFVIKEKIPYRIEGVWRKSSIQLPKTQVDIDHSVQSESGIRIETPLDKVPNDPFLGQTHIESSTEVPVVPEDTVETLKRQIVELSQNCQHFYQQHQRSEADKQSLLEQLEFQVKVNFWGDCSLNNISLICDTFEVNSELKSLLIATMGDDLQTKLESLSVDKVRLGQNIVEFTKKLNDDFEVLDKMNIQCDMWRSKFLASR